MPWYSKQPDLKNNPLYLEPRVTANETSLAESATNVKKDGAKGDGTDDTTKIQSVLSSSKYVLFPYGSSFKVTSLTIPDNTIIIGYGAKIYSSTAGALLSIGNGVKIYGLEIQGLGNGAYNDNDRGIQIQGTWNGTAINYVTSVLFEDCYIHDFGGYGAHITYAKHVRFNRCKIENIGYAGILTLSCENVHVTGNSHIRNITPGSGGLAYGVTFTRNFGVTDLVQYPRSKDCSVIDSTIEDIPLWEGLDTHGGQNIMFQNNTIRNCKVGIACVAATGDGGTFIYGVQECTALGNHIYGLGLGYGIVFEGVSADYASACIAQGNQLFRCGAQGNNINGAIRFSYTKGIVINGNTLNECYSHGISLYNENKRFSVTGNNIRDVQDNTFSLASCVGIRSTGNEGVISGNTLTRENTALNTYVSQAGILISTSTSNDIVIGINSNNCATQVSGGNGQSVKYGTYGDGMFEFIGSGTPESVITAKTGSRYTNIVGGAGTTFYIKQSGVGNTGWVAL